MASWQDATGETDVMREGAPSLEGLAPPDAALANSHRLRRIAEAAFWDSLAGLLHCFIVTNLIPAHCRDPSGSDPGKYGHVSSMQSSVGTQRNSFQQRD